MPLKAVIFLVITCLGACRNAGESPDSAETPTSTISGVVKSSGGSQAEMASWVVVFVERDTGIAQHGVLGSQGEYAIESLRLDMPQTILLLDPFFRLAAVTSAAGTDTNSIKQYFTSDQTNLPSLVHQGSVIKFSEVSSVFFATNAAADSDGDLIPNGMDGDTATLDSGGTAYSSNFDIDGDGIVNWFDDDDDGDGLADVFDIDADGNEYLDLSETTGQYYFSSVLDFIAVQVVQDVQADSSLLTSLILSAKVSSAASVASISVEGASLLFEGATTADSSDGSSKTWDGTLADDGFNEDGGEGDFLYARTVTLAAGVSPMAGQVLFFKANDAAGLPTGFPYSLPRITSGVISATYDVGTRTVSKVGSPFGSSSTYSWSLHVFDAAGTKVYGSEPIEGSVSTFTIPSNILGSTQSYTAQLVASTLEPINSYPIWAVKSVRFSLE